MEDPLTRAILPPSQETSRQRDERLRRETEAKRVNDEIDKGIREDAARRKKERQGEVRILLLGQASAGKTTVLKQMRLLYDPQAHDRERKYWKSIVHLNIITALRSLLEKVENAESLDPGYREVRAISPSPSAGTSLDLTADEQTALLERLKLDSILQLENDLRRRLGAVGEDIELKPAHFSGSHARPDPVLLRSGWQDRLMERLGRASNDGRSQQASGTHMNERATEEGDETASLAGSTRSTSRINVLRSLRRKKSMLGVADPEAPGSGIRVEEGTDDSGVLPFCQQAERKTPLDAQQFLMASQEDLKMLWHSPAVKRLRKRGALEDGGGDSDGYFLNNLERIAADGYQPTDEDILHARVRTVGASKSQFRINATTHYSIYDVCGSRSSRHTWTNYFDDAHAIIFLAPLSSFNQTLIEDPLTNRLQDSLDLFRQVVCNRLLRGKALILFLNKIDILERKLRRGIKLADFWKTYGGNNEVEDVWRWFRERFREEVRDADARVGEGKRLLYVHTTIATSTKQIGAILSSVNDTILRE